MSRTMKAALMFGKGDLRIQEVPVPRPGPGEILARVEVALTCATDLKTLRRGGHVMIPQLPSPLGHEFAGVVEEVGEGVEDVSPGTRIVTANSAPCFRCQYCRSGRYNLCDHLEFLNGAYAEYIRIPSSIVRSNLHTLPDGVLPVQAALTEPLACVLNGFESSGIEEGQTVCVLGTGPIGLLFVALAARKGARVIAVGRNPMKLRKAKALGACVVLPLSEGEAAIRRYTPQGRGADVVIEAVGRTEMWELAIEIVKKGGLVNLFGGPPRGSRARIDAYSVHYGQKSIISIFHHTPHHVAAALGLLIQGVIRGEELITHRIPLNELPQAFEWMSRGEALKVAVEFPRS